METFTEKDVTFGGGGGGGALASTDFHNRPS